MASAAIKSPHPPFGHLLPFFEREKAELLCALTRHAVMGEGGRQAGRGLLTTRVILQLFLMANLDADARDRARNLRKHDTQAERLLWEALRARRLGGFKFVRQLAIGPYFADFACREHKLIVEIDGASHGTEAEVAHDQVRTEYLVAQGWRVRRAWNQDVFTNLNGVCDSILLLLREGK